MKKIIALFLSVVIGSSVCMTASAKVTMYAPDGRTISVHTSEVSAYQAVGWYKDKKDVTKKIYAPDGRAARVFLSEVNTYLALGWYDDIEDVTTDMFAADGRRITVYNSEVSAYKKVGWTPVKRHKLTVVSEKKTDNNFSTSVLYSPRRWAMVSPVQQFEYKDKGLAYAYLDGKGNLKIIAPNKTLTIAQKYKWLGDVIADENGNFYVVWGQNNMDHLDTMKETVFISKYKSDGSYVKTTGFVGESVMGTTGNTQVPFDAGNCSSAIGDGKLMVNYARKMYNGHQSNNVIGVNLSDMSPVKFDDVWSIPYTSHSFDQRVIWSRKANEFLYADHGDAYPRGIQISKHGIEGRFFTYYLEQNANYNMFLVNETKGQLGSLLETDAGAVLVGASVKSIGHEGYNSEKQNLFIQIFDPEFENVTPEIFVGGNDRTGYTSLNIYDNQSEPQTKVTDYGVIWLTSHSSSDVLAPHAVVVNNKIIILWNRLVNGQHKAHYMVLADDGKTIVPATELGVDVPLNPHENLVAYNGKVYWAASDMDSIKVMCLDVL